MNKLQLKDHPGLKEKPLEEIHPGKSFLEIAIPEHFLVEFENAVIKISERYNFHFNRTVNDNGITHFKFYCRNEYFAYDLGVEFGSKKPF